MVKLKESKFTLEDITNLLEEISKSTPNKINKEADERFRKLTEPYLHMTEEEMKIAIPNGAYEISGNGYMAWTGKLGLIMCILQIQKQSQDETKTD